jgi:hypothetical protein
LLKQSAVYWAVTGYDGFGGRSFAEPVELAVRWEDRQQLFVDLGGQEAVSRSVAYLGTDVENGGYLYLGTLNDLASDGVDPLTVGDAQEIRSFEKIPSLDGLRFVRKAWLVAGRD